MFGPEIIKEIIKLHDNYNNNITKNGPIYNEMLKNFELNGNTPISELDTENIWIEKNNNVGVVLSIYEKSYNNIINLDEYIYCTRYFEKNSKAIAYTFQYKSYVIKPYLIITHDWEPLLKDDFLQLIEHSIHYTCTKCSSCGKRKVGGKYIVPENNMFLTCNEHIIKNIIE